MMRCFDERAYLSSSDRSVFHDIFVQTYQMGHVMVAIDSVAYFKTVDDQNSMSISKYGHHNLASLLLRSSAAVHLADCRFDTGVYW